VVAVPPGLAAGLVVLALLAAGTALARPQQDAPALTLDKPTLAGEWREGWFKQGAVRLSGTVGGPARLMASVRPTAKLRTVTALKSFSVRRAGSYSTALKLPARPLPGSYRVSVSAQSGGVALQRVDRDVTLPTPVEGVVSEAIVSARPDGAATVSLPRSTHVAFARFVFLAPPRAHKVALVWRTPAYQIICQTSKGPLPGCKLLLAYRTTVHTYVRSFGGPLARGTWYCILMVGNRVAKRVAIRIR
jgi:hypothetical protein